MTRGTHTLHKKKRVRLGIPHRKLGYSAEGCFTIPRRSAVYPFSIVKVY